LEQSIFGYAIMTGLLGMKVAGIMM